MEILNEGPKMYIIFICSERAEAVLLSKLIIIQKNEYMENIYNGDKHFDETKISDAIGGCDLRVKRRLKV